MPWSTSFTLRQRCSRTRPSEVRLQCLALPGHAFWKLAACGHDILSPVTRLHPSSRFWAGFSGSRAYAGVENFDDASAMILVYICIAVRAVAGWEAWARTVLLCDVLPFDTPGDRGSDARDGT